MYCSKCGVRNGDENKVCHHCGAPMPGAGMAEEGEVPQRNEYGAPRREREYAEPREVRDEADTLAGIAACCIPLVGIVLYLVWRDKYPRKAKSVCGWTIGGLVITGIFWVIAILAGLASAGESF